MLYISKPQTVEAILWTGDNFDEVSLFAPEKVYLVSLPGEPRLDLIAGVDGAQQWVSVPVGHWLVHQPGDHSDIWPVGGEYFSEKYEPA